MAPNHSFSNGEMLQGAKHDTGAARPPRPSVDLSHSPLLPRLLNIPMLPPNPHVHCCVPVASCDTTAAVTTAGWGEGSRV